MAVSRKPRRMLETPQWRALRSQLRLDVLMTMEAHAPCSIAELASVMGRRPASLYRHVQALVRAELLQQAGRKTTGRRWASVFALGPAYGAAHFHAPSGQGLREHGALVLALARPAGRAFLRAMLAQRGVAQATATLRCFAMFERTWLDAKAQAEVRRLLDGVYRIVQRGRRTRRGERFQISVMSAPTAE